MKDPRIGHERIFRDNYLQKGIQNVIRQQVELRDIGKPLGIRRETE